MNTKHFFFAASCLIGCSFLLSSCTPPNGPDPEPIPNETKQLERLPWTNTHPEPGKADFSAKSETMRLEFYGWGLDKDTVMKVKFPESTTQYRRAILTYRMGAWGERPGEWDILTMIMIKNKQDGEFYEFVRAISPYGNGFNATWFKEFYIDITEYLPMLTGETVFHVYYGGWDATATRAHTVTLSFDFYEGEAKNTPVFYQKIYDSRANTNNSTYRAWAYGDKDPSRDIENAEYLGIRNFTIPSNVDELLMKVSITGHGMEQGKFPDRKGYKTRNAAEFDENFYNIIINGESKGKGHVFYKNDKTYPQAGTYAYDRAGWGPGLPINTQYWTIKNLPKDGKMSIDFNLDKYISDKEAGKSTACYAIEVDIFGLDNK